MLCWIVHKISVPHVEKEVEMPNRNLAKYIAVFSFKDR